MKTKVLNDIFQDNNQSVIHRQSTALLSHGLTGLSSWPASIYLGDYLMKRKYLLENKYSLENIILIISIDFHRRIIELGAGSGLLGLALLKYSDKILSYTFTDYSPMILNLLRQNVLLNFSEDQLDVTGTKLEKFFTIIYLVQERVKIEELDWNQYSTDKNNDRDCFDLILAAGKYISMNTFLHLICIQMLFMIHQ